MPDYNYNARSAPAGASYTQQALNGTLENRDLTTRNYRIRAETIDKKARSVEAVIATENRVVVLDWNRFELLEEILLMEGAVLPDDRQVPLLDTHNRASVSNQLGSARDLRIDDGQLIARNHFSASEKAKHAWTLTEENHLRDNSIGYQVLESVTIDPGESGTVGGSRYTASANMPLRIATSWVVRENSICPVGADAAAKNRKHLSAITNKNFHNANNKERKMDFKKWLQARGIDINDLDDTKRAELEKEFKSQQNPEQTDTTDQSRSSQSDGDGQRSRPDTAKTDGGDIDIDAVVRKRLAAERSRVNAIRKLGREHEAPETVIDDCIDKERSLEEASLEILHAVRNSRPKVTPGSVPAIHTSSGGVSREILAAGLLMREGLEEAVTAGKWNEGKGDKVAEQAHRHRNHSLVDMCRMALQMDNQSVPSDRNEMINRAFSTVSLPEILSNVANKALMRGYQAMPQSWRRWCGIGRASDFKEKAVARLTDTGDLEKVTNSGEVKHGSAAEEAEKYSIATYAKQFGLTRQNMIDDDLGAFVRFPQKMGATGANLPGDLVYAHLIANQNMADNVALFHDDHNNLNASNALDKSNLATAIANFRKQKDLGGRFTNVPPRYLVVPAELAVDAMELVASQTVVAAGDTDLVRPSMNALSRYGLEVVDEPRLSDDSATSWYLMADPAACDTIEVSFLNGVQIPQIERFPMGADYMGVRFRVYLDVGCKAIDFRGMQKNNA